MIRDNLIPFNSSFSDGTTGWTNDGTNEGSLASHTADKFIGDKSLIVTKQSASVNSTVYMTNTVTYLPLVNLSGVYSVSAYIKIPSGQESGDFQIALNYHNGTAYVSSNVSSAVNITSAKGWTRVLLENVTAPSTGVTRMSAQIIQSGNKTVGQQYLVDAVKIENSAYSTQYIEKLSQSQENKKVNIALSPLPIPNITGMKLDADIMLNDLVLNTIDEDNNVWVCTDIQGWWGLPDSEYVDLTRGLSDGNYDVQGRYGPRVITLTGSILSPTPEAAVLARNKLIKAVNLVSSGDWLIVNEGGTAKSAFVRLSGAPEIENVQARGRIDFSIGLKSADPLKYSWNWQRADGYDITTVPNGGSAVITNNGNMPVTGIFSISAEDTANLTANITIANTTQSQTMKIVKNLRAKNYSVNISASQRTGTTAILTVASHAFSAGDKVVVQNITTSGRTTLNTDPATITNTTSTTITYTCATSGTLANAATNGNIKMYAADSLEIDTYNRTALLNSSPANARSYLDTMVSWITLAPGDNTITFADNGGANPMTVKYNSGWIG
jgi:hypothetical protein